MFLYSVILSLGLLAATLFVDKTAPTAPGQETARALQARYFASREDCGSSNKPRFLCTGVILRGTTHLNQEQSWAPTPEERANGGTAYSYLAWDVAFDRLALNDTNGYIIYPGEQRPQGIRALQVLCFFPADAGAHERIDNGCGQLRWGDDSSRPCYRQGIDTARKWHDKYISNPAGQCGFSVANGLGRDAVTGFNVGVQAAWMLNPRQNNELRAKTWEATPSEQLPIQAFFYLHDSPEGMRRAQNDQRQFYQENGTFVPIITLTLPQGNNHASFNYFEAYQAQLGDVICKRYFVSGRWFERADVNPPHTEWALGLLPTDCARAVKANPSQVAQETADREMREKFAQDTQWVQNDKGGMTQQMVCHMLIAHDKPYWNLEPFRPNLSLEDYLRAGCNPLEKREDLTGAR